MSGIVRTIMKIVLIIIGLIAATAAEGSVAEPQYYYAEYYQPYPDREVYRKDLENSDVYNFVPYQYQKIGLHGFGFETRLAFADGLRNPITPKTLAPYYDGYRLRQPYGDVQYAPIRAP